MCPLSGLQEVTCVITWCHEDIVLMKSVIFPGFITTWMTLRGVAHYFSDKIFQYTTY